MFAALSNVAPPLLLDRQLFNFSALRIDAVPTGSGIHESEDDVPWIGPPIGERQGFLAHLLTRGSMQAGLKEI